MKDAGGDKAFMDQVKKVKDGNTDVAKAELAAVKKGSDEAATKSTAAAAKKDAAATAAEAAVAAHKSLDEQQSTVLSGYKSTVWSAAISPDGKHVATGAHRVGSEKNTDTIKIWDIEQRKVLFPWVAGKKE